MSTWAERVHRRAADFSSVVTSCGHPGSSAPTYPYRLEKVKFGVSLDEVCKNDNIPGPLLVLILKLNKESPNRRDVFRAPGHQGAMKKLIHFLQAGRLVNVDNYSVYTIASVLKKFLRKIPNGIFGRSGENELFAIIELSNEAEQNERLHKLFTSLPKYTQHLLVLLFGTFRVIASNADHAGTGMTSEALGVSVAPSFFQSCVSDGKTARMEDVLKFKVATKIMKYIIDKFATHDLFGRDNYEYYARVTGRILKVQDEWICSFQYPPPPRGKLAQQKYALQHSLEAEKTWLQCQCERWGLLAQEESRSTPALLTSSSSALDNSVVSLGVTPEHSFMESCARLSVSLEGPGLFAMTSSPLPNRNKHDFQPDDDEDDDIDDNDDDDDANDEDDRLRDFTNDLDISSNHDDENIENQSKNANFHMTSSSTSTSGATKSRRTIKSRSCSHEQTAGASVECNFTDSPDDVDGDEMMRCVVKRRYKQNKKKSPSNSNTAQIRGVQQQRRLRTNPNNSKSIDAGHSISTTTTTNQTTTQQQHHQDFLNDYEFIGKPSTSSSTLKALTTSTTMTTAMSHGPQKSRVCSRCKRGIRHSSSCSSSTASGGAAGTAKNGSGMTMDELRAVNRYAESTKSLSYLPQVHERQTARMRTRSEWFLGPKDGDILCVAPNTCSNCYLTVHGGNEVAATGNYLGGGSTRDMRRVDIDQSSGPSSGTDHHAEAVNTSLFLYYKQQQQNQRHPLQHQHVAAGSSGAGQRQSFHLAPDFMMDTDEGYYYGGTASNPITTHSSIQQQQTHLLAPSAAALAAGQDPHLLSATGAGLYLDANYDTNGDHEYAELPCCSSLTSKLSYQSLRQQQLLDVEQYKVQQHQHQHHHHNSQHHKRLSYYENHDADDDDSISLNSANANITSTTNNTATTNTTSAFNNNHQDDVDYKLPSSSSQYRHSTPMMQNRRRLPHQQAALRRQRLPSSSSSSLYQSFNASLQAPMLSATANSGEGHNSRNSSLHETQHEIRSMSSSAIGGGGASGSGSSNSNFVSIVFNVLDFLF
uniref:Rho-GAP domain-containing protein n=1 Tax=Stomoxys calcitrans TaxID=35570 RepID=A0A1I8Q292_STOCA